MKKKTLKIILIVTSFLFYSCSFLFGQKIKTKSQFDSLVNSLSYPIEFKGDKISGDGAEWLVHQAKNADYFLIGERHGTAEIPQITGQIYSRIAKLGYDHTILEIGLFASYKVQRLLKEGGYDRLKSFLEKPEYHQSIAFLDWREEALLAAKIAEKSPLGSQAIWGIDQEFILGGAMYLNMLKEEAKTEKQEIEIQKLFESLNENKYLIGGDIKQDLENLKKLYSSEDKTAVGLIEALLTTNQIYGRFRGEITRVTSNALRENLMKVTFKDLVLEYENETRKKTKVFFKLGGFHSGSYISLGHSTFGTFVEEWAISRNEYAFNLFIDSNGGKTLLSGQDNPQGGDGSTNAISQFGHINPAETEPTRKHVFSTQLHSNQNIFLIDLRPLRENMDSLAPFLNAKAIDLISGFDAYMAIPNVTPATPILSR